MIEVDYDTHPDLYFDFRKTLKYLSEIDDKDYDYPDEILSSNTEFKED